MSLQAETIPDIPADTARVAHAAFPKGTIFMTMRDVLGALYEDSDFADLYSDVGQPALSPWRLALVAVMQFAENLTDRQAADAVRGRIDWKYALSLELTDPGFNYSVLSEFRTRLLAQEGGMALLDKLLAHFKARGLVKAGGRQRTDATHVLAAIHALNRIEFVAQTLQYTLDEIARVEPNWLKAHVPTSWFERYKHKLDDYRLPKKKADREQLVQIIGEDGYLVMSWLEQPDCPARLPQLDAVDTLRQVWTQQFDRTSGVCVWRDRDDVPASAERIASPHDVEARFRMKRHMEWVGYQVHFTESCDDDMPHFITHVETTAATVGDSNVVSTIHQALAKRDLLPKEHITDTNYGSGEVLHTSRSVYGVDLLCPSRHQTGWQAQTDGASFHISKFAFDWENEQVTCPMGKTSRSWRTKKPTPRDHTSIQVTFNPADCEPCPARQRCTRSKSGGRELTFLPYEQTIALQQAREYQQTDEFTKRYCARAGIEGTIAQTVAVSDARRSRYVGLAKTGLQQILTAIAANLIRFAAWLDCVPLAPTRISPFAALAA